MRERRSTFLIIGSYFIADFENLCLAGVDEQAARAAADGCLLLMACLLRGLAS
jgi:hypothetical protein